MDSMTPPSETESRAEENADAADDDDANANTNTNLTATNKKDVFSNLQLSDSKPETFDSMTEEEAQLRLKIAQLEAEVEAKAKAADKALKDAMSALKEVKKDHYHHQQQLPESTHMKNTNLNSITGTIDAISQILTEASVSFSTSEHEGETREDVVEEPVGEEPVEAEPVEEETVKEPVEEEHW